MGTFLAQKKFFLFGDLHVNSRDLAIACEEAGADSIIFHLNQEVGGGFRFAGLEIEEDSIRDSMSVLKVPLGITIGDTRELLENDWEVIADMGFAFVNMFAHQLPIFVWNDNRLEKIVSIGPGYILEQVRALSELDNVSAIVAALTPNQGIGLPFTILDGTTLRLITSLSSKPVLVPTQRKIRPQDIVPLTKMGCRGLLLTTTAYGETPESCREKISTYRTELSSAEINPA